MENRNVKVISTVDAVVGINDPQVRVQKTWERKGTVRQFEFDTLQELCYNPGVWNLFLEGILYIEDMEVKIALGLESEDAEEPTNIVVLTDAQKKRYLTVAPLYELKAICKTLTRTEVDNLIEYAIANEITNYDKAEFLKTLTGRDIIKTIELNRADKND